MQKIKINIYINRINILKMYQSHKNKYIIRQNDRFIVLLLIIYFYFSVRDTSIFFSVQRRIG